MNRKWNGKKKGKKRPKNSKGFQKSERNSQQPGLVMYLKEMGSVPLLSREEEVEISKRIEKAQIQTDHHALSTREAISIATFLIQGKDIFE